MKKGFLRLIYHYLFFTKYLILFFYLFGLVLNIYLLYIKEISNFFFIFNLILINLYLLIILFIKKSQTSNRYEFLKLIYSLNIQNTKLVGVEVGVLNGDYSKQIYDFFCQKFDFYFYLVDPWKTFNEYNDYDQKMLDKCYTNVKKKFEKNKKVEILRKTSQEAVLNDFQDESLDFVYIDGNHDYDHVIKDLETWFKKLKTHGVLFGDDYSRNYGVHKAVNEFSFKHKLVIKFSDNFKQFCIIKS